MKYKYETWWEYLDRTWRPALCKLIGHAKEERHLRESICSRCRVVTSYHGGSIYRG
jgi:hypothetical protein